MYCPDPVDEYKNEAFSYVFTLRKPGQHKRIGETERCVFELVKNGLCTTKQIALYLHISTQNIQKTLKRLFQKGLLKREKIGMTYQYTFV